MGDLRLEFTNMIKQHDQGREDRSRDSNDKLMAQLNNFSSPGAVTQEDLENVRREFQKMMQETGGAGETSNQKLGQRLFDLLEQLETKQDSKFTAMVGELKNQV